MTTATPPTPLATEAAPPWDDIDVIRSLVVNLKTDPYDVYIGRPGQGQEGPWGNPFKISEHGGRIAVIEKYQHWLNERIRQGAVTETELAQLASRTLGCYCAPQACHGHVLARYALAAADGSKTLKEVMREPNMDFRRRAKAAARQRQVQSILEQPQPELPTHIGKTAISSVPMDRSGILTPQNNPNSFLASYDFSLNPYQGCAAACDYCYASQYVPREALSRSWGDWVKVRRYAADDLARNVQRIDGANIYMASLTDPYQPVERVALVTRRILEIMATSRPRLVVQTRFPLVTRDVDQYQAIAANGGSVQVNVTVTTDDDALRRELEPRCPSIPARMKAVRELADAGITTMVTVTPMLPVSDPAQFAEQIRDTGADGVIIQPFHDTGSGSGQLYRRATRPAAIQWFEKNWGHDWRRQYQAGYAQLKQALSHTMPGNIREGKSGFAPR